MEPRSGWPGPRSGLLGSTADHRRVLLLAAAGAVLGAALLLGPLASSRAHASPPLLTSGDDDSDGLPNVLEVSFGSDPFAADSDGDTQTDLEEWVLRTNPLTGPSTAPTFSARVFGYPVTDDPDPLIRIGVAVLSPSWDLDWLSNVQLVVMLVTPSGPVLADMRGYAFADPEGVEITSGPASGAMIAKISFSAPLSILVNFAPFSVAAGNAGGTNVALDGLYFDALGPVFGFYQMAGTSGGAAATFQPIDPTAPPPGVGQWTSGQACVLTMDSGGNSGVFVLVEVTDAGCQPYPGLCDGNECAQKVGTAHMILDVLGVIGNG